MGSLRFIFFLGAVQFIASQNATASFEVNAEFFEQKVRPILIERCQGCHGEKARGGLKLDSLASALAGGGSGPALIPGDAINSLFAKAIRREDEMDMPPDQALPDIERKILESWVAGGAPWPKTSATVATKKSGFQITDADRNFWSFKKLLKPDLPPLSPSSQSWVQSPVDQFIRARLDKEGISPVEPASPANLIRRVSYDLTGLPPSPRSVQAFERDHSALAYRNLVDRLLSSPQYGERWGRHWLDVVRYAESEGSAVATEVATYQNAFRYRDFVIDATNRDMPFDQFVAAHLAGDQLQGGHFAVATGWAALGPYYYGTGGVARSLADEWADRVDTMGRGFLGLTVACARCHDHKYDPISTRDYYSLAGIFHSSRYTEKTLASPADVAKQKAQREQLANAQKALKSFEDEQSQAIADSLAALTSRFLVAANEVSIAHRSAATVAGQAGLDQQTFERWVKYLQKPEHDHPFATRPKLDVMEFADAFQALLISIRKEKLAIDKANLLLLANATLHQRTPDYPQNYGEFTSLNANLIESKSLHRDKKQLYLDVFENVKDDANEGFGDHEGVYAYRGSAIARFLTPKLLHQYNTLQDRLKLLQRDASVSLPFVHVLENAERTEPDLHVQIRGNSETKGELAPQRFLAVLSPTDAQPFSQGSGRLELSEVVATHPLTTRVIVNRVWQRHFGTGLVATASNFGVLGERPSHPELLEYLAVWFDEHGRSLKQLHRLLLLSSTYQLSSRAELNANAKDASARLRWRMPRRRLDMEEIRDSLLAASGSLDKSMAGPSFPDLLKGKRRTVYAMVSRNQLQPLASLFDFPEATATSEGRQHTNVPLQKLVFLNSPFVLNQAQRIAKRLVPTRTKARVVSLYLQLFSRAPSAQEVSLAQEFVHAKEASWESYVHALLGTNEFIFVD